MSQLYDAQAEYDLLAVLLAHSAIIYTVSNSMKPEMFYVPEHRTIYEAMLALHLNHQTVDLVTLSHQLKQNDVLTAIGGPLFLADLLKAAGASYNAPFLAEIVIKKYRSRKFKQSSELNIYKVEQGIDPDKLIDEAQQSLVDIRSSRGKNQPQSLGYFAKLLLAKMVTQANSGEQLPGISTHFHGLDEITKGFSKGDVIVLAARPQMGKTTLAMNIALNIAKRGEPVLMVSMEMSGEKLSRRLFAAHTGIRLEQLQLPQNLTETERFTIETVAEEFDKLPIEIIESTDVSPLDVSSAVYGIKQRFGGRCGLVILDYLQLMKRNKSKFSNTNDEISDLSRNIKGCAMALDVPILELSQLNRAVEMRQDKRPMLSDLRDSGAIEQDADVVMFIYRDEVYYPNTDRRGDAEIIVAKNRDGITGTVKLLFQGATNRFLNPALSTPTAKRSN